MGEVRGCEFPDGLLYEVASNIWVRPEGAGEITLGMTSYGCCLAGPLVAFTPRRVGKEIRQGRSCATVESGKWVGPIITPVSGVILAVNETLYDEPRLINRDPYGAGWLVRLRVGAWERESRALLDAATALREFETRMNEDGFEGC